MHMTGRSIVPFVTIYYNIVSTHLWHFVGFPAPAPNTSCPDPGSLFWAQGLDAKKRIKCQMKLLIMEQLQRQLDKLFKKYAFAWFLCQWEDLECLVYFPLRTLRRCTQIHFPSLALKGLPLSLLVVCHSVCLFPCMTLPSVCLSLSV